MGFAAQGGTPRPAVGFVLRGLRRGWTARGSLRGLRRRGRGLGLVAGFGLQGGVRKTCAMGEGAYSHVVRSENAYN